MELHEEVEVDDKIVYHRFQNNQLNKFWNTASINAWLREGEIGEILMSDYNRPEREKRRYNPRSCPIDELVVNRQATKASFEQDTEDDNEQIEEIRREPVRQLHNKENRTQTSSHELHSQMFDKPE